MAVAKTAAQSWATTDGEPDSDPVEFGPLVGRHGVLLAGGP